MMLGLALIYLCVSSVTASLSFKNGSNVVTHCIEKEREALLAFKADFTTTFSQGFFTSWSTKDCCKWSGVYCSNRTGHVIKLDLGWDSWAVARHHSLELEDKVVAGKFSRSLLELKELNYLDLTSIYFGNAPFPKFISSFTNLRHLDLSNCAFSGAVPSQLGNLSNLNYLAILGDKNVFVENLDWLSRLSYLETLKMDGVDLSRATNWVDIIKSLPFLSTLNFKNCQLSKVGSPSSFINSSSSRIKILDLSANGFTSSMYSWLFNMTSNLVHLNLQANMLNGPIFEAFGDYMPFLQYLDLSYNSLVGMIPSSFGKLCNLVTLDVRGNSLSGNFSNFVDILSGLGCASAPTLAALHVDNNKYYGPLPDGIIRFSFLQELSLSNNLLNGTLTNNLGTLSHLRSLDLSFNSLTGIVSEAHFSSLSRLTILDLSRNHLDIKVSPHWFPKFQLRYIALTSCNLGPLFPYWIQNQKNFTHLDISNTGISDNIPPWFWELLAQSNHLNLSSNFIGGTLPDLSSKMFNGYPSIDLSSNNFQGSIPSFPSNSTSIILSRNKFSGTPSFLCQLSDPFLNFLDISHNLLNGELPDCFVNLTGLLVVSLAHNRLYGDIPSSLGSLFGLQTLYLYNNSFSGELPMSLSSCQSLNFLDVGENNLTGNVPGWIGGNLSQLYILSLRSNKFLETIPLSLCQLNKLQVLDLSKNELVGIIPPCLNNLSALVQIGYDPSNYPDSTHAGVGPSGYLADVYADYSVIGWQGREQEFENNLKMLKSIDLSSNNLNGEIPIEITKLFGLVALNLSRNLFQGKVPRQIGQLKSILTLDLSRNRFSGKIPASLSQLNFLNYLDLSYNKLSGKIPSTPQLQTFNASQFVGNVGLCGAPLTSKCPGDESSPTVVGNEDNGEENEDDEFMKWLYIGMASGFVTGFWGICGALFLNRRCRHAFFLFVDHLKDKIYVKMAARRI